MTATAIIIVTIFFLLLAFFMIVFVLFYNQKRKTHEYEKNELESRHQQEILKTQLEIQEQTLKTISQEIHDNVGQILSLAKINLNTFERSESGFNQTRINDTKQLLSKAINDLRDLSRSLYADKITDQGLVEAISNELRILKNSGLYNTSFECSGEPYRLNPQHEIVLFRMVQEALHNSIKHAQPEMIMVVMHYNPTLFILKVSDNGKGFDLSKVQNGEHGMGLKSMYNRSKMIGAELNISSTHSGTEIKIEMNQ